MSQTVKGNTQGLAASGLRKLQKLYHRRLDASELVSLEVAREVYRVALAVGRRVGLLVSREGRIEEVFVGSREILYLPDLGRYRLGEGRLRRLRLIFSDLSRSAEPHIPADIYTDLQRLRLDAVVSIKERDSVCSAAYAYLVPAHPAQDRGYRREEVPDVGRLRLDFAEFTAGLEQEIALALRSQILSTKPKVMLVGVYAKGSQQVESSMLELRELARTAGVEVLEAMVQRRQPDPKTLLGRGKLEEVVLRSIAVGADVIIFDTELKPSQWRAITNSTELKVLDRSMLILDIFAQHAKSADGRLQVELAQLKYNLPRLVEKDTGLSRLSGGIGGRGPGETKLEIGRRRIRDRIIELEKRIQKLGEARGMRRRRRKEGALPLIAILGYTNVGKSTLFNALTRSDVLVENKLFATLDPAQRRMMLPTLDPSSCAEKFVVVSDTVGFIRDLPKELTSAFRATLEELGEADLLLHVLDASDPEAIQKKLAVERIIESLGSSEIPVLVALNKCDLAPAQQVAALARECEGFPVSARLRSGLTELKMAIAERLRFLPRTVEASEKEAMLPARPGGESGRL